MPHSKYTGRPSLTELSESQKAYIDSHYQTLSVIQMCQNRHIPSKRVYAYMNLKGYASVEGRKKVKEPSNSEFFQWNDFDNSVY